MQKTMQTSFTACKDKNTTLSKIRKPKTGEWTRDSRTDVVMQRRLRLAETKGPRSQPPPNPPFSLQASLMVHLLHSITCCAY